MTSAERKRSAPPPRLERTGAPLVTPMGMGDLLPPEAAARRELSRRVLRSFELAGYELVTPPVFEHADVVERGNDTFESRDLLRFVEPESGEVAVLRPDITPQIARIVATRLTDHPPPFRLCYEGRVFRRQRGRARNHRQVTQAGVECVGLPFAQGDTEVLALAIRACEDAGLEQFRIELSDIRLVRSLLDAIPADARGAASEIMAQKDAASLRAIVHNRGVSREVGKQLEALLTHYGERDVLTSARRHFRAAPAQAALASLQEITDRLADLGLGHRVCFDLSETRGLSYYTGMHFSILAHGPGEALGGGGRYDTLLARFGFDATATGFALDLGNLQWTLRTSGGAQQPREPRLAVASDDEHRAHVLAEKLRKSGLITATLIETDQARCLAFARTWGYDAVLRITRGGLRWLCVANGSSQALSEADIEPEGVRRLLRSDRKQADNRMEG
jgi:ATP phosphoribosyltransferase regulatory subunit